MAELMDQSEIDALLNSSMEDLDAESDSGGDDASESSGPGKKNKIFTFREIKNRRFTFPYHSPVVKQKQFILNPEPDASLPEDVPIVRTLNNYVEYVKRRRIQSMT